MYKIASRKKLRIQTNRGMLSVEQLWDLSKEDIGELAKSIRKRINDQKGVTGDSELDFLKPSAQTEETIDELTFRILKDIYTIPDYPRGCSLCPRPCGSLRAGCRDSG